MKIMVDGTLVVIGSRIPTAGTQTGHPKTGRELRLLYEKHDGKGPSGQLPARRAVETEL